MQTKTDRNSLYMTLFGAVIIVAAVIFVYILVKGTMQEADVIIGEDTIEITGQYGTTFALQDVEAVELRDHLPKIVRKVNSAGLGSTKKGDYELEGYGRSKLYLHSAIGPYIFMKVNGRYIYINFAKKEKTTAVFEALLAKTQGL